MGAAWVELLKSSVTHRDGSESDSLDPPDTSCAGRALPVFQATKFWSGGPKTGYLGSNMVALRQLS